LGCFLCSGCAINAPYYRPSEGTGSKDGLIVVEYFDMTHAENLYKGKSDFSRIIAEYVAGALQERGFQAVAVERQNTQVSGKYRITGEITKIDQGNWQGRFWVAPGVGMACISAQAALNRVSDNTELARAKEATFSTTMQSTESILRRVCAKVSREIAGRFYDALRNDTRGLGSQ
ncbi:MAG: DUF4410 domain-containing protein, partial [Candidatus Omnitrophica bacterium]|nr:DUF4410 domain-containing protein [Candidatus Omnitrophota bacterium]